MRRPNMAWFVVLALMTGVMVRPAWALGNEIDTLGGLGNKLFRGIVNLVTGWGEIPKQISLTWQESGPGPAWSWGLAKGVGFAVGRTAAGAYEIVTFPAPIPDGYRPIFQPEYVFSDLQAGSQGKSVSE